MDSGIPKRAIVLNRQVAQTGKADLGAELSINPGPLSPVAHRALRSTLAQTQSIAGHLLSISMREFQISWQPGFSLSKKPVRRSRTRRPNADPHQLEFIVEHPAQDQHSIRSAKENPSSFD